MHVGFQETLIHFNSQDLFRKKINNHMGSSLHKEVKESKPRMKANISLMVCHRCNSAMFSGEEEPEILLYANCMFLLGSYV